MMTVADTDLAPLGLDARAARPTAGKLMTVPISFAPALTPRFRSPTST
jgi:hypothetical protein